MYIFALHKIRMIIIMHYREGSRRVKFLRAKNLTSANVKMHNGLALPGK